MFDCIQAFAEEMHERVRKEFWAYSTDEQLNTKQLHQIKYDVSCLSDSFLCLSFIYVYNLLHYLADLHGFLAADT